LVVGNDSKKFLYKKYYEDSEQSYLTENWNRYTFNYFWSYKRPVNEFFKIDFTTGVQNTMSNHVRLSGKLDEVKDQYYYEDFDDASIVDQSNRNSGFYAEFVADYKDKLFITIGERIEQNEYFGKDYGTHISPRFGFSYLFSFGKSILKTRGAWGSGGINPPRAMQALPSESSTSINLGNPDLRPERQSGYEIGADFYFGDNFFVEFTFFDQLFLDGIANDPSIDDLTTPKQEYMYINLGQIINKGIEVAAKTRIFDIFDISANYTYLDSRWGKDSLRQTDPQYYGFYDKGKRRIDVPSQTGNISISLNLPGTKYTSDKGGSISLDVSYIGERKGRDWLLYYDGFYNPEVEFFSSYRSEILMDYDPYYNARLRLNYSLTNNVSFYLDIRNLNNHTDISRSITEPALGRQIIIGTDLDL
jgi:outer membrane receptor protein involved in Fe transport